MVTMEPLDELYLRWLYSKVSSPRVKDPSRTWWYLLRQLYTTEFVWIVSNDGNRCEEGVDLRQEFIKQTEIVKKTDIIVDENWMDLGCSVLEMLVALSRRCSFENDGTPSGWFWQLINNLGLGEYNDASNYDPADVDEKLTRFIWRRYRPDGEGGLFPLKHSVIDQRKVEIWYQLQSYLLDD